MIPYYSPIKAYNLDFDRSKFKEEIGVDKVN